MPPSIPKPPRPQIRPVPLMPRIPVPLRPPAGPVPTPTKPGGPAPLPRSPLPPLHPEPARPTPPPLPPPPPKPRPLPPPPPRPAPRGVGELKPFLPRQPSATGPVPPRPKQVTVNFPSKPTQRFPLKPIPGRFFPGLPTLRRGQTIEGDRVKRDKIIGNTTRRLGERARKLSMDPNWRGKSVGYWISPEGEIFPVGNEIHNDWMLNYSQGVLDEQGAMHAGWHRAYGHEGPDEEAYSEGKKPLNKNQKEALGVIAIRHRNKEAFSYVNGDIFPVKLARPLDSTNHDTRVRLAKQVLAEAGLKANARAVLSGSSAGVTPAVAAVVDPSAHPAVTKYAAAWLGMLTGQRRVTVFHPGEGNDILHVIDTPFPHSHVAEYMRRAGLPGYTLEPQGSGTRAFVLAPLGEDQAGQLASGLRGTHAAIQGTATRLGASQSDSDARTNYRQVMDEAEKAAGGGGQTQ